ncbi:MAG: glycosyltransferase family 4 protein, partial [Syntrophales bacterium]|nr:glycosyltransferase family 4 protein [Syntrophales bacterium]
MQKHSPYRIAVVIPKYGLVGGAEGFAAELTERIALDERYEIHVFANSWQATSPNITFHKVPMITFPKFMTTPSFAFFAGRQIAKTPCDLIHTHDRIFEADLYTLHGIPHRVWSHDVRRKKVPSLFDRATYWVEEKMITNTRCRRILAVSSLARDIFIREYRVAPEKVPIVHPGITMNLQDAEIKERYRLEIRQRFGIPPQEPLMLFVSMNFDIKGLDAVMTGIGELNKRNPAAPFRLLIVGKGNESHYKRLAQNLGIADRILFAGVVDKKTLEKIYA